MTFHKAHQPGELTERIDTDANALSNFFSSCHQRYRQWHSWPSVCWPFFQQGWQYGIVFTLYAITDC